MLDHVNHATLSTEATECAAVDEGYWGDDEEEIAFVKRWNCDPKTLGAYGEDLACELLKRNDYIILERNWSCAAGEADIIALDDRVFGVCRGENARGRR